MTAAVVHPVKLRLHFSFYYISSQWTIRSSKGVLLSLNQTFVLSHGKNIMGWKVSMSAWAFHRDKLHRGHAQYQFIFHIVLVYFMNFFLH